MKPWFGATHDGHEDISRFRKAYGRLALLLGQWSHRSQVVSLHPEACRSPPGQDRARSRAGFVQGPAWAVSPAPPGLHHQLCADLVQIAVMLLAVVQLAAVLLAASNTTASSLQGYLHNARPLPIGLMGGELSGTAAF